MSHAASHDQLSAGVLALLVHLLFFLAMVFGVSWKTLPEIPVYADLWRALPEPPPPPEPEPMRAPPPVAPLPPVREEPQPKLAEPDIALERKKAERKKKEDEKKRLAEEKKREAELKKQRIEDEKKRLAEEKTKRRELERRRQMEDLLRQDMAAIDQEDELIRKRKEVERKAAETKRLAQEKARKEMEDLLSQQTDAELDAEDRQLQQRQMEIVRDGEVKKYTEMIQEKVGGKLRNPLNLRGKPVSIYHVDLLPNGEVLRIVLVKSSGQRMYDQAVEVAIRKASPLPLPRDKAASAAFLDDGLELKVRPKDE